jgi:hypothetical protein
MRTVTRGGVPGSGGSFEVAPDNDGASKVTRHVSGVPDAAALFDDTTVVRATPGVDGEPTATAPTSYPEANLFDDATLVRALPSTDEPAVPLLLTTRRKPGEPSLVLQNPAAPGVPPPGSSSLSAELGAAAPADLPPVRSSMPTLVTREPPRASAARSALIGALCIGLAAALGLGLGHLAARRAAAQAAGSASAGAGAPTGSAAPAAAK